MFHRVSNVLVVNIKNIGDSAKIWSLELRLSLHYETQQLEYIKERSFHRQQNLQVNVEIQLRARHSTDSRPNSNQSTTEVSNKEVYQRPTNKAINSGNPNGNPL